MTRFRSSALIVCGLILLAGPALAQAAPGYNVSWSALDPGDDWSAQIIQSVFPVNGAVAGKFATGTAATVIGTLLGRLTGFVSAIAMAFLCYTVIMQIHRGAETGRVLSQSMTSMFVVRLGFAAVLMYPLPSGFSAGQKLVVQTALWGAGMARTVYNVAVTAIGPDAMVIADPIIPGTKTIVLDLIQTEFCRALINAAAANPAQVPAPTPAVINSVNGSKITWEYRLASGNGMFGGPTCGTVTIAGPDPAASGLRFMGVNMSMAQKQQDILTSVIANDIRSPVEAIAQEYWTTKQQAPLARLQAVLTTATTDYNQQIVAAATAKMAEVRSAMDPAKLREGDASGSASAIQLSSLGWTSAGAYFLEFSRLNGAVLSLMSAVPTTNAPSYRGLGWSLGSDVAPVADSAKAYLDKLATSVATTDGIDTPGANSSLFTGTAPSSSGAGIIDRIMNGLNLNESLLKTFTDGMSPTGSNWADPFGALTQLGHKMIMTSLIAFGLAGVLNSTTLSTIGAVGSLIAGQPEGAVGIGVGSMVMGMLATPIFALLTGILIPGLTLAFVLPMIPWIMWMAGVTGWLILVCEAVIAVPLWMLAHMTMGGDGLHGRANEGYSLLFNVLFRPTLMIFGLFMAYFVFGASSWLIRVGFSVATSFVLQKGWFVTNLLGVVVLLSIFVTIHIVAAVQSFKLITLIPHHLPRLIGFSSGGRVDMEQYARDAALVGVGGTMLGIQNTMKGLGGGGGPPNNPPNNPPGGGGGPANTPPNNNNGGGGATLMIGGPARGGNGMDSTLRAATDNLGRSSSEEA